jgi:hypothetical protein
MALRLSECRGWKIAIKHEAGISQPASDWGKTVFCLAPSPSDDLINSLFRNTEVLGDTRSGLTSFETRNDSGVPIGFLGRTISLRPPQEWWAVQHLHDVKCRQPNAEASCGFDPPMGTKGHGLLHRLRR